MKRRIYIVTYSTLEDDKSLVAGLRPYRLYAYLKKRGVNVELVTPRKFIGTEIVVPDFEYSRVFRQLLRFIPPDNSILWGLRVYRKLKNIVDEDTIVITTAPPHGLSISGYLLKKRLSQVKWIADYRDLWVDNPLHSKFFTKKIFDPILERLFHKVEDLGVFNTNWDMNLNISKYPFLEGKAIFVRNGVDQLLPIENEERKISFIYAGGTTKGQATKFVDKVMKDLNDFGIESSCEFYGEYDSLMDSSPYIRYKGVVQAEEIPAILSTYKFGFIYLPEGCERGGRIAQKFYDYLGAGVIPICYRASIEMVDLMTKYSTGIGITDQTNTDYIVKAIESAKFNAVALDLVELTREYQFEKLYNRIEKI